MVFLRKSCVKFAIKIETKLQLVPDWLSVMFEDVESQKSHSYMMIHGLSPAVQRNGENIAKLPSRQLCLRSLCLLFKVYHVYSENKIDSCTMFYWSWAIQTLKMVFPFPMF